MNIILKQDSYRVKNGFAAHSPELGVTAHGHSLELARRNLERLVLQFLKPFERQGILKEKIQLLKLKVDADGGELRVCAVD